MRAERIARARCGLMLVWRLAWRRARSELGQVQGELVRARAQVVQCFLRSSYGVPVGH